jgi:site-specific recombinase XerD
MARTTTRRPSTLTVVTPQPTPALERLVDDYLSACRARGLSPKTVTFSYGYPLRDVFLPWCAREGITGPAQLTSRILDRFTSELLEKGGKDGALSKTSVITYTRTVNLFLRWATTEGDVAAGVKAQQPKAPQRLVDILSRDEIQQLEDAARNERDKLIVRVLADAGLRLGELMGLRTDDLKERVRGEHYLHVTGKGQRERLVPLTPALHRRLQKYIAQYRARDARSDRIFLAMRKNANGEYEPLTGSGVNQLLATLTALVGIKKRVYPHLLRHSFATYFLQKGGSALDLARILGHSSLAMINTVYAHLTPQDAHVAMMKALLEDDDRRR